MIVFLDYNKCVIIFRRFFMYCRFCGKKINKKDIFCPYCGKSFSNKYIVISGIVMFIMGISLVYGVSFDGYDDKIFMFLVPGILSILSSVCKLFCFKSNKFFLISGCLLFIGALSNFISIMDLSIYALLCVIFGIFDIIHYR